jgi:ribonuclease HI
VSVVVFTDGACIGNPGPGGFAAIIHADGDVEHVVKGREPSTTNNRMEMMAAIRALEALQPGAKVRIHSDSKYLIEGMTSWLKRWKSRGWRTKGKTPVLNQDLWEHLDRLTDERDVTWGWVRGHSGHALNERADALATAEASQAAKEVDWVGRRKRPGLHRRSERPESSRRSPWPNSPRLHLLSGGQKFSKYPTADRG